jgi:hypothetical protein
LGRRSTGSARSGHQQNETMTQKNYEPCGSIVGEMHCVLPKGHDGQHDDEWPTEEVRPSKERVYREALQRIIAGQSDIETPEDQVRWMWSVANNAIACANGLPDETFCEHPKEGE